MNVALTRRWVLYGLRRLGPPGWLGLAVLAAAAAYAVVALLPAADRLQGIDQRIGAVRGKLGATAAPAAPVTPAEQLAAFYREFPRSQRIPDVLSRIHTIAADQALALEVGEYALTQAPEGELDRFRITLPLKGGYPQVRRFAAQVLAAVPTLSLESMSLRREQVGEGAVEARVVFVLFLERAA